MAKVAAIPRVSNASTDQSIVFRTVARKWRICIITRVFMKEDRESMEITSKIHVPV